VKEVLHRRGVKRPVRMTRPQEAHSNGLAAAIAHSALGLTRRDLGAKRGSAVFLTTGTPCCFALSGGSTSIVTL